MFWSALEKFNPSPDYRLPYRLSDDYWMFTRMCKYDCSNFPAIIIGDSFIWGQYVTNKQTLSNALNILCGENLFANMGIDGLHPAAMAGLIKYYGKDITDKGVILHLNPLWMTSKKHDLQGKEEFRFNHPGLVPQFIPDLACYKPSLAGRIGIIAERNISFFSWIKHIRNVYFENMDIQNWSLQNPYTNPLDVFTPGTPQSENKPRSKPVPWTEQGMKKQNFPWVVPEESFQWSSFKKSIEILRTRNNDVFIIIGPFNPYILSDNSLKRYNVIRSKIEKWLKENNTGYYSVPDLPGELYPDASHTLKEGYFKIAEELFKLESFKKWLKNLKGI